MIERSENFVMTINPKSKADNEKLEAVRSAIKTSNRALGTKLSIKCHGRLGKSNPKAGEYKARRTSTVKLADAARWDVYIFNKGGSSTQKAKAASKKSSMANKMTKKPATKRTTRTRTKR